MSRPPRPVIEYRNYPLSAEFPIQLLTGAQWRISEIPAGVLHFHDCLEIGLCETDSGVLGFQREECRFAAGDITIIAGDVPHTTWSDPGTASKWSWLHLDPEELLRPFFPAECLPDSAWYQNAIQGHYYILPKTHYPTVYALATAIMREMQERRSNYQIEVRALVLLLCIELMRLNQEQNQAKMAAALPVAPALDYIKTHYMEDFSIEMLADLCGMSQSHFRRIFKSLLGIGPLEYLNRTRVLQACSLMRISEDSILTISERVGFQSLSSFNRHFMTEMGVTPSRWRKAEGNNPRTSILKYAGWLAPPPMVKPDGKPRP